MNPFVFGCTIAAALIAIIVPVIVLAGALLLRKIKLIPMLKGMMMSFAVHLLFLPTVLSALNGVIKASRMDSVLYLVLILVYTLASLGVLFFVFAKIFRIKEDRKDFTSIAFGYIPVTTLGLMASAFQNLVLADHVRVQDWVFLNGLGLDASIEKIFQPGWGLYYLSIGLAVLMAIALMALCLKNLVEYIDIRNSRLLLIAAASLLGFEILVLNAVQFHTPAAALVYIAGLAGLGYLSKRKVLHA